jgi:MFS family permease
MNASAIQAAFIIGPALAGVLYALGDNVVYAVTLILFISAVTAYVSIPSLAAIRQPLAGSEWEKFVDGLRFIRSQRIVLGAISLDLFAVLFGGATALMPILAAELLHTGAWGLGLMRSAPAAGALLMSAWLARVPLEKNVGRIMFTAVSIYSIATVGFGLSSSLWLSLLLLAILGAADMVSMVIRGSLVQLQTPDHMRGRVSAVNSIFIGASNQLGEFESGLTAAWFGAVPAVILGGVCSLAITALWMRWFPQLRKADKLA